MKKIITNSARTLGLKLTALLFMMLLFGGNMSVTATVVTHTFSATSGTIDANISFTTQQNSSVTAPAFSTNLRLYYSSDGNGCSITLTPSNGAVISQVKITAVNTYTPTVKYSVDGGSDATATLSSLTYTITGISSSSSLKIRNGNTTNTQLRITSIEVTYSSISAPTVTTNVAPTSISATSATMGGAVTATGGASITDNGIVYALTATNATPTTSDTKLATTALGSATGTFSTSTNTLSVNTQYSYRAYATNSAGTSYGGASGTTFYTYANVPNAPTLNNATTVAMDIAIDVNANPTNTQFAIHETSTNNYVQADGSLGATAVWQTASGWGTKTVIGLTASTTYTFEVKARNGASTPVETAFGSTVSLSTASASSPILTVGSITSFGNQCINGTYGPNTFTISGSALTAANITVAALNGFTYSTDDISYSSSLSLTQAGGSYSQTIYVKFLPTSVSTYDGNIVIGGGGASDVNRSVVGSGINTAASISTPVSSSISNTTAVLGGNITATGCSNVTERGIYYSTSNGFADGAGTKVSETGSFGTATFTLSVTGLTPATTYYYKAYATNSGGTAYTTQGSFNTLTPTITVGTVTAFGNQTVNTTSAEKSFTVSGTNLTNDIIVTPPAGFEISTTSGLGFVTSTGTITLTQAGGTISSTTIYVRFKPTAVTSYSANISLTSTNATSKNVAVSGTGTAPADPATFSATVTSSTQINLTATANANGNEIVVIYNSTGTFTSTTNGIAAGNIGDAFAGGTIIYKGSAASITNHTGLTGNTTYYYKAFSYDAQYFYSSGSIANATTVATVPYFQNFEGSTNEWTLANTGTNKWAIGSATNNGGSKAMYISKDNGTTNAYTVTSLQSGTDASLRIDFTGLTSASMTFDWKSNGEFSSGTAYDFGEVYINTGASDILISGTKEFNSSSTFTNKRISLTSYVGGIVTIKFRWVNDVSTGNQPPFAVDNISITSSDVPSITTTSTTSINVNSAVTGGNISADGGSAVTARGVCYGTSSSPTIAGSKTTDGSGTGSFTSTLTGLIDNTNYYVRAYATNSIGTAYGNEVSFTTLSVSSPTVTAATNINSNGFTANWGAVTGANSYKLDVSNFLTFTTNGIATLNEGFDAGTTAPSGWTFTSIGGTYTSAGNYGSSSPSLKMDASNDRVQTPSLSGSATQLSFWIKGQGTNATSALLVEGYNGSSWVSIQNITNSLPISGTTYAYNSSTSPSLPSNITQFRFTYTQGSGNLSFDDVSINYNGTTPSYISGYNDLTVGSTSTAVTTLSPGTTYYYRVRAVGGNGTSANSGTMSVTTSAVSPTVSTATPTTSITATMAVSGGNVSSDGGATISVRGICYGTSSNPDITGNVVTATGTTGTFTSTLTGLTANTTYHVRAYATNSAGTSYGSDVSFTTLQLAEPSNHPASFTATATSTTQIDLSFAAPSTVSNTAGYLILQRQGAAPSGQPTDGVAYTLTSTISDATVAALVTSSSTTIVSITGLTAGTLYYFTIYPYNWDGVNTTTYNYLTTATPATVSATTATAEVTVASGTNTNWSTLSNTGLYPNVTVTNSSTLTLNANATVSNVTVEPGSAIVVNQGQTLNINGNLTIQSPNNLGPLATFINMGTTSVTGTTTVQRYLPAYTTPADGWHLISCPFDGYTIAGSPFEPAANEDLYSWRENDFTFLNYTVPANNITLFNKGMGYLTAYNSSGIKSFTSTTLPLINSDVTLLDNASLNTSLSPSTQGWHLVGNSFTSDVIWDINNADWMQLGIVTTFQVWNDAINNYIPIQSNGGIIPALQGFFVQVNAASNLLVLPKSARVANTATYNKSKSNVLEQMKLKVSSNINSYSDLTYIGFNSQATNNFDYKFDSRKLYGGQTAPQLFSIAQGEELSVNTLPNSNNTSVSIGFKPFANGNYTITASDINTMPLCTSVTLEDLKTNTFQNLMQNPVYNFTAATTDNVNRFILHFTTTVGVNEITSTNTSIYAYDNNIYVNASESVKQINVYNALGQLVKTVNSVSGLQKISMNGNATGYYIVRVITDKNACSEKVLVK